MADVHSKETRSFPIAIGMNHTKAKDTKPEMMVRKFSYANGYLVSISTYPCKKYKIKNPVNPL